MSMIGVESERKGLALVCVFCLSPEIFCSFYILFITVKIALLHPQRKIQDQSFGPLAAIVVIFRKPHKH
jgi:hypothetical protein